MKIPFELSVMFFMILSGVMLIIFAAGQSSPKIAAGKAFKPILLVMSGALFLLLLCTAIFVVEW